MQKKFLLGISACALALCSCSEDWGNSPSEGKGYISPLVDIDTRTISSRSVETRADITELKVEDLTLSLTKNDGSYAWKGSLSEFPSGPFTVGTYLFEASYGDANDEGFEKPALYGSQTLTVADEKTTQVSLSASPSNAQIKIVYSDAFQKYMADWNARVNDVFYDKNEIRPVYVKPGDATIKISITKPNGVSADFTLDKVKAKARYVYTVNVTVNQNEVGDAVLDVEFDENFETDNIEIDLSDKVLTSPAPQIDIEGFVSGSAVKVVAGLSKENDYSMSLIAMAGLKEVNLETSSPYLLNHGWPESVDLMSVDAPQSILKEFGLDVLGLWKNPGEMAFLNFKDVLKNILIIDKTKEFEETIFTLTVKDKLMRESEPVVLDIKVEPLRLELISAGFYYSPGDPLKIGLKFNGSLENLKNGEVIFEYQDNYGRFRAIPYDEKNIEEKNGYFIIPIIVPDTFNDDVILKARCGTYTSNEFTFGASPFEVVVEENNVFAHHAYVKLRITDEQYDYTGKTPEFLIKGGVLTEFTKVESTLEGEYYKLTGLPSNETAGVACQVKIVMDNMSSKSVSFTTEALAKVPNGDFEELVNGKTYTLQQGGEWTGKATGIFGSNTEPVKSEVEFTLQNANNWLSSNMETLEGENRTKNTWFKIPSVFNSSISYTSTQGKVSYGLSSVGGKTGTPNSYKKDVINGTNSMVIRNVGWSLEGDVEALNDPETKTSNNTGFSSKYPDLESLNKKVGRLFLGSVLPNGSIEEGIKFTSRPKKLSGSYNYTLDKDSPGDSDHGLITVEIVDVANNTIATGSANLEAGETSFSFDLAYVNNPAKAAKLKISIVSSNYKDNDDSLNLSRYNDVHEAFYHGATLVIDDLTFEY